LSEFGRLQEILDNGVRAARAGDRETAQRLLKQVIAEDPNNELALIWLASSVTSSAERRMYLQQVVRVNPNNKRARDALAQLSQRRSDQVESVAAQMDQDRAQQRSAAPEPADTGEGGALSRLSPFEIGLIVTLALAIGVGFLAFTNLSEQAEVVERFTDTPTPVTPSSTPRPTDPVEVIVTREAPTLPPTFTPTATATQTNTPVPTATPFPLPEFEAFLIEREQNNPSPVLFKVDGLAQNPQLIEGNVRDVIYDLSGRTVALVKDVTYPADEVFDTETTVTEIFVGPSDDPASAEQLTFTRTASAHSPTFSPEANQLIFVSDFDGDDELWLVDINTRVVAQLTDNENIQDRDPDWSPDGTRVVFASDREFSGSFEIQVLEFVLQQSGGQVSTDDSLNTITQLTNDQGSSLQPKWSDDGNWIAYVNTGDGDGDILMMDSEGLRRQVMTLDDRGAEDKNPSFTPDRRYISFISNREDERFQAYLVSVDRREIIRLTNTENIAETIDYRPMLIFRVQAQN